jgi:hypothetical protein
MDFLELKDIGKNTTSTIASTMISGNRCYDACDGSRAFAEPDQAGSAFMMPPFSSRGVKKF